MESLSFAWDQWDATAWGALIDRAGRSTLEQCWAYGVAIAAAPRWQTRRLVMSVADAPVAVSQVFQRPIGGLATLVRVMRGPLAVNDNPVGPKVVAGVREHFAKRRRQALLWLPELAAGADAEALMRGCGLRQMVTGYSTVWLDLTPDAEALRQRLKGSWRNQLKKAEASGLNVVVSHGGPALVDLLGRYDQLQRAAKFAAHKQDFYLAFANAAAARDVMVLTAMSGGEPVAGVLVLGHGQAATYTAGWTSDAGRTVNAHNLLLWRAVTTLREDGRRWFDLGGVETSRNPGIARFKLGMGGEVTTLAGTYL